MGRAKGKAVKEESDDDEDDFDVGEDLDDEEEDADDEEDSADDEEEEDAGPEAEADEAGPSSGSKRKRASKSEPGDEVPEILEGLSGDEVDPGLIISAGRRARRGRGDSGPGSSRAKYTAEAQLDSDEDEW